MRKQVAIVVGIVRNEKGEMLIAKRKDPDFPEADNKWEFVGGKIEFGEDPETAVMREIEEETGYKTRILRLLPKVFTNIWTKKDGEEHQVIILCFECGIVGGKLHEKNFDRKIAELRFIDPSEIKNFETLKMVDQITDCLVNK